MNENKDSSLYSSFFHDSAIFILEINRELLELEKNPRDPERVEKIFRATHSLKSEADYLNEEEIAEEAHKVESALEAIRSSHGVPTREQFDEFFACSDRIQEMLAQLQQEYRSREPEKKRTGLLSEALKGRGAEASAENGRYGDTFQPDLSEFEKVLLKESLQRGERFLRISVELDPSTPMPYAKAYLILNNLEQLVSVVHTEPLFHSSTVETMDQNRFLHLLFFCTGSVDEKEIYRAVNIDLVRSIKISPLEYKGILEGPQREDTADLKQVQLSVEIEVRDLDDLNSFVDELKIRAYRLKRDLSMESDEIKKQLYILTTLIDKLENFARKISLVNLKDVLQRHGRLVRDQARRMNKDVQLVLKNCEITVDRRAAELISDMVLHLLRNAVVHGIENPVERSRAHKDARGTITISAAEEKGRLSITVADDGAGIDGEAVRALAFKKGINPSDMEGSSEMDRLLAFLVHPGMTTKASADSHAGRGLGLDLVYRKIRQFEGGRLEMETKAGKGTKFRITLPSGFSVVPLLVVRYLDEMFAVPARYIEREVEVAASSFFPGEKGEMLWEGMNVFTPEGRLFFTDMEPEQKKALIISYLGSRALLLIDEVLFKKEIPEDSMTLYIAGSPYIHRLDLYGSPSDFFYLSPSLVVL
jgi:two-component system chemotaxis sensor kinase CheA